MKFFITGHTGFKGTWLSLLLLELGNEVSGYSLDPVPGSLFDTTSVKKDLAHDIRSDIRDSRSLEVALKNSAPDVVIHMAAQPLVRESYRDPINTFEINVNGTLNVLQATTRCESVSARVIVTTDKVYRNKNRLTGYVEEDELGGDDPYSASKSMADILTQSWIKSFPGIPTAIARGGNVIGGGDISKDRLIPDLITAFKKGDVANLRYPNAVRPWQHALDCVNGYLALSNYLLNGGKETVWNFGPDIGEFMAVYEVAEFVGKLWGIDPSWRPIEGDHPHESELLVLNTAKARSILSWREKFDLRESLRITSTWYSSVASGDSAEEATLRDIRNFIKRTS